MNGSASLIDRLGGALPATDGSALSNDMTRKRNSGEHQSVSAGRPVRLLVFTSLYPNVAQPRHGVFVEERLRHLVDSGRVSATVVAPVPWFPFRNERFGAYATFARVPAQERRYDIDIHHPRYPIVPKVGMSLTPSLMYHGLLLVMQKLLKDRAGYDLIDAHYLYPDGVAAVALGRKLGLPVVITARGNDVTLIPQHALPRRRILGAAANAAAVVTVSAALRTRLLALGAAAERVHVLRNGVDLERFCPLGATDLYKRLGLRSPVWLTVGHMIERKGMHFVIEALAEVPEAVLVIAGDGPEEQRLRQLSKRAGVESRVRFVGAVPHSELCDYYNSADALFLASSREGMPNVVLESLACGTPVVAAPFAGAEELISAPEAGEIAKSRTAEGMWAAWHELWNRKPDRAATRRFAENLGWGPVVEAQCALYAKVLAAHSSIQRTREAT
jgi:glycosyltransferase involved in cell wall biosynthesis